MDLSTLTLDELERHYTAEGDDERARLVRRCLDAVDAARKAGRELGFAEGVAVRKLSDRIDADAMEALRG